MNSVKEGFLFVLPLFSGILTLVLFSDGLIVYGIHSLLITLGILFISYFDKKESVLRWRE